jgi:hypothetical protein
MKPLTRRLNIAMTMRYGRSSWRGRAEFVVPRGLPSSPLEGLAVEDTAGDSEPDGPFEAEEFGEAETDEETVAFGLPVVIALAVVVPVSEEDVANEDPPDGAADFKPKPIRFLSKSKTV